MRPLECWLVWDSRSHIKGKGEEDLKFKEAGERWNSQVEEFCGAARWVGAGIQRSDDVM